MQKQIGEVLRAARERAGLSQHYVAREAKIAPAQLSRIEAGRQKPYFETLARLANAIHLSLDQIAAECGWSRALATTSRDEIRRNDLEQLRDELSALARQLARVEARVNDIGARVELSLKSTRPPRRNR